MLSNYIQDMRASAKGRAAPAGKWPSDNYSYTNTTLNFGRILQVAAIWHKSWVKLSPRKNTRRPRNPVESKIMGIRILILLTLMSLGIFGARAKDAFAESRLEPYLCSARCEPNEKTEWRPHPACGAHKLGEFRCWTYCSSLSKKCERKCEFRDCQKV
jgi:hypothetical protein